MVSTLGDASLEHVTLVTQPLFGAPQREVELREVLATDVAQLATFQVVPDPFDGVEIRRVAWKLLQIDPLGGSLGQEVFDRLAAVNGGPIPDDEEFAAHLAQEQAQETDHLGTVIGPRLGLQEEAPVAAEGADGRAMIAGELGDGARRWMRSQTFLDACAASACQPLAHRPRRDPEGGSDRGLFPARFFQLPSASPPSFAPVQPGFGGLHGSSISNF